HACRGPKTRKLLKDPTLSRTLPARLIGKQRTHSGRAGPAAMSPIHLPDRRALSCVASLPCVTDRLPRPGTVLSSNSTHKGPSGGQPGLRLARYVFATRGCALRPKGGMHHEDPLSCIGAQRLEPARLHSVDGGRSRCGGRGGRLGAGDGGGGAAPRSGL